MITYECIILLPTVRETEAFNRSAPDGWCAVVPGTQGVQGRVAIIPDKYAYGVASRAFYELCEAAVLRMVTTGGKVVRL